MTGIEIKPAWRIQHPELEHQVLEFWKKFKILPDRIAANRLRELAAVAFEGDDVIGVATAPIGKMEGLPQKFAMFRCSVAPPQRHRRRDPGLGVAADLMVFCRELFEKWSENHPEEQVMGMVTILEGYRNRRNLEPYWPEVESLLIGYTQQGHQVRLSWFKHARVS